MSGRGRMVAAWITGLVCLGSCAATCAGLAQLLNIGTCASGGPYVIARACPVGTGANVLLLGGGITVATFAIIALSFMIPSGWKWGMAILFLGMGGMSLILGLTRSHMNSGESLAVWILAATFLPIGLWPAADLAINRAAGRDARRLRTAGVDAEATVSGVVTRQTYPTGESLVDITYRVQPPQGSAFEITRSAAVLPKQMPRTGSRVSVRYDPKDPTERYTLSALN